jgi:cytochrome c oxidase subunit 2
MYGTSSTLTGTIDNIFLFFLAVSVFFLVLITGLMIYFAVKYRRSKHPEAVQIEGSVTLEVIWTVVPVILVIPMFWFGFAGFRALRDVPEDAMVVQVTGRMWDWSFRYENGKETDKLYVPVHQAVKLVLHSVDVNHSFFIPAFRVKEDVIPGRENYLWFKPRSTGSANVFCAEYCGQSHSYMMTEVVVLEDAEFRVWLEQEEAEEAGPGAVVLMDRVGCLSCHSMDGTYDTGPTFRGLYGSTRTVFRDGSRREVVADEEYLRRAILDPHADQVVDYPPNMPPPVDLSEEEVQELVEYIKSLAGEVGEAGGEGGEGVQ